MVGVSWEEELRLYLDLPSSWLKIFFWLCGRTEKPVLEPDLSAVVMLFLSRLIGTQNVTH